MLVIGNVPTGLAIGPGGRVGDRPRRPGWQGHVG